MNYLEGIYWVGTKHYGKSFMKSRLKTPGMASFDSLSAKILISIAHTDQDTYTFVVISAPRI